MYAAHPATKMDSRKEDDQHLPHVFCKFSDCARHLKSLGVLLNETARNNGCARKFEAVIVCKELASCRRGRRRGHCGYLGTI